MPRRWLLVAVLVLAVVRSAPGATRDVTAFGAVPGDATSDTPAIAAAVAASQAGDVVFFPAGTYLLTDAVRPASGTTVAGAARDATVLRYVGTTPNSLVELTARANVEITALTLDGNHNPRAENGIEASDGSGHRLHDLAIRALTKGSGFGPHGIHFVTGVTDSEISDNRISDIAPNSIWGAGLRMSYGSSRNRVERNTITTTGRGGILLDNDSHDAVIRANVVIDSGGDGLGIEVWSSCHRALIEDNAIDHWLSVDRSSGCAVRRNVVRDPTGAFKYIGIELAGGDDNVFTDNVVGDGQQLGISVSTPGSKDNVLWAYNTVVRATTWGVQLQGEDAGVTHHYFYRNAFLETPADHPHAAYPQAGNGFRMNGDALAVCLESNRIADNAGDGIQFSGMRFDQLAFVDNAIVGNAGASVSADPGGTNLRWDGNVVAGNGVDRELVGRGFAGPGPTAAFSAAGGAVAGAPVVFTNTSSAGSGTLVRTLWDFGDGLPATDVQPTHVYDAAGIYRVSLVVWDSAGRGARAERLVQVAASPGSPCASIDCRAAGDQCRFPACDETAGACTGVGRPDGTTCDDGLFCTGTDGCAGGSCSGLPRDCSDGDRCTTDACDEGNAACTHAPIPSCGLQDALQQRCLLAVAKSFGKLAKAAAKLTAGCVAGGAKGTLGALACLGTDPRGKLATAGAKVQRTVEQRCTCPGCRVPDFGYAVDLAAATGAVGAADPSLTTDVFGTAGDLGLLVSSANTTGARCQQAVYRDVQEMSAAYWTGFLACLKDGLRGKVPPAVATGEPFVVATELAACVGHDPQRKIERARARLAADATTSCVNAGVSLGVFAGACGTQPNPAAFVSCLAAAVETRTGTGIRAAHAL